MEDENKVAEDNKEVEDNEEVENKEVEKKTDGDYQVLAKSLEEEVVEGDKDAQEVIDAVPFIKALMDALEDQITAMIKAIIQLSDEVKSIKKVEKAESIKKAEGETTINNYTGCVVK